MTFQDSRVLCGRRSFLRGSVAGLAAISLHASTGDGLAAAPTPSGERIRLGMIGLGWRGGQQLSALMSRDDCDVVAVCDPEAKVLDAARAKVPQAKVYADLRKLLDDDQVDAVVISTCNHWHCLAAVWACQAGKDVYVEKPLSYTLWEGRQLINAARNHGRIVQVGTQQRSDPMQREIRAFLHDEQALGAIESVAVTRFGIRQGIGKRETPLEMPKTLDYDLWLGPAEDLPMFRSKVDYDWHWDWNTGNGECANWGVHVLDDVRNVVFRDAVVLPSSVACGGGRVVWNDAGQTPNLLFSVLDAGGIPVVFALSNLPERPGSKAPLSFEQTDSGYIVHCAGGSFHGRRGGGVALDRDGKVIREFKGSGGGAEHFRNFFDAIRSRDQRMLTADVAVGHDSTNWSHLINAAWRAADAEGFLPPDTAAGGPSTGALERLLAEHVAAYGAEIPAGAMRLSRHMDVDVDREAFAGPGCDAANAFLGPRRFRPPFVLEPQPTAS